jgi:hypothetical protein
MGGGGSLEMPAMEREKGMASLAVPFSSVSEAVVFVLKDHGEAWWWKHMFDEEEMKKMLLQGLVLSGQVLESTFYDQVTGVAKPGYSVKLTVLDAETDEKYECQLSDGLPSLEQLQELKKQGQPADVLRQVATQLEAELPPKMSQIALQVRRIKGKGSFQTLVCRLATAA